MDEDHYDDRPHPGVGRRRFGQLNGAADARLSRTALVVSGVDTAGCT
jgi:hypothetical protein